MNKSEIQQQALTNATSNQSESNYAAILDGFANMGIPIDDIKPRENIFTYNAWKALNRQVSKGQHGVKVVTWVPMSKTDKDTGKKDKFRRPKTTTVFHISQTDLIDSDQPSAPVLSIVKPPYIEAGAATVCDRANKALAGKLRDLADNLQSQIDGKFADRLENTAKRRAQGASSRHEGERLKRTQTALYAMADLREAGNLPELLHNIRSKKAVYDLMGEKSEQVPNGYHAYTVGSGEPYYTTPEAVELWKLLKPKSAEDKAKDALADKIKDLQFSNIPGYFPTPKPVIDLMVDYADIWSSHTVLEPSAGSGAILDAVKPFCLSVEAIEYNHTLCEILAGKGYSVVGGDFLDISPARFFDRVLMNPPFENLQDIDHVQHAFKFLESGGRMVSVMAPGAFFRQDKKCVAFREWFDSLGGEKHDLPENSFKESGTNVNSVIVIIDKD